MYLQQPFIPQPSKKFCELNEIQISPCVSPDLANSMMVSPFLVSIVYSGVDWIDDALFRLIETGKCVSGAILFGTLLL